MIEYSKYLTVIIVWIFAPAICQGQDEQLIQGRTMGTTYHVKVVTGDDQGIAGLKERIDARLEALNSSMSTYQKDSEISRFNRMQQAGRTFKISADFYEVMLTGQTIFKLSEGAWDATINPLVDLWGFGRTGRQRAAPSPSKIAVLLPQIGFEKIRIRPDSSLVKKNKFATIDLSSIAKGYGVDQTAALVRQAGYKNFLVEIGGEIFAAGKRPDGKAWRIGINRPRQDAAFNEVFEVVDLSNKGFATSGDYRNFFEVDGIRYSHVIDPRTGYPVSNGVVSVSILAANCTMADGLATAIMVMGLEKGLDLINRLEGVEGLIIVEKPNGRLDAAYSREFKVVE